MVELSHGGPPFLDLCRNTCCHLAIPGLQLASVLCWLSQTICGVSRTWIAPLRVGSTSSRMVAGDPALALASWAAISASHGQVLTSGPLTGLQQDINRAELTAACAVLAWTMESASMSTLWTDSTYVSLGIQSLLEGADYTSFDANEDLWLLASGFLEGISVNCFRVQHINSHLAEILRDDPLDDWLAFWNDAADHNATLAHAQRSEECTSICHSFRQHHLASEQEVDKLRDLHLAIGHLRGTLVSRLSQMDDVEPDLPQVVRPLHSGEDWLDGLPLGWMDKWRTVPESQSFPLDVVKPLVAFLFSLSDQAEGLVKLSWLEIAALLYVEKFVHPQLCVVDGSTVWSYTPPAAQTAQLTVAARVRYIKSVILALERVYSCGVGVFRGINCVDLGIHSPQSGILLGITSAHQTAINCLLLHWTSRRPVRTANDLCRPFEPCT